MTKITHNQLDQEEARLLANLRSAARLGPDNYVANRKHAVRRFAEIDAQRVELLAAVK